MNKEKRKAMDRMLVNIYSTIGIDVPTNHSQILDYVVDDVNNSADSDEWHDGDVSIAFRRWIEEQTIEE